MPHIRERHFMLLRDKFDAMHYYTEYFLFQA